LETDTETETNTDTSTNTDNVLPNAPLTMAALKDLENEQYSAFFKSLQQVREKSPERFCSKRMPSSIVNITDFHRSTRRCGYTCLDCPNP
jgi:hypothetical protein